MKDYQSQLVKRTVEKFTKAQMLKQELISYLEVYKPHLLKNPNKTDRLKECGNILKFRRCLETGEKELVGANACGYDRICIGCATRRAIKMIKKFEQGINEYNLFTKNRYYIVLTVKHNENDKLEDLVEKLMRAKDQLARNYKNSKRVSQKSKSFFNVFEGMASSIEIAHKGSNGWHPHLNILGCTDKEIDIEQGKFYRGSTNQQLLDEWLKITGDSYIHNIRKITVKKDSYFGKTGIGEVFKYAIKFSDLTIGQLADVMELQEKKRYRFFSTYGIFRGWKLSENKEKIGNWHEGVFLFDSEKYNNNPINTNGKAKKILYSL